MSKESETGRVDPFAEMSVAALENVLLRLYADIAASRKCMENAKRLRQQAWREGQTGRELRAEAERDIKHVETMLALRRGEEVNVVPFPVERPKEKVLGRGKKRA